MELTPVQQKFVLHWGEMGQKWGINRTVAQIHALLYISARPLDAEEIATTLDVARSNVSNSLRELQGWGIVKVVHVMGDRRDHYESLKDVWELFRVILDERRRRESDPTLNMLRECVAELDKPGNKDAQTRERLAKMLELFEVMTHWYEQIRKLPTPVLSRVLKFPERVAKVLVGKG